MKHACGLCGSLENVVGPYGGGPVPFLCEDCHEIIEKWEEAKKRHRAWFRRARKEARLAHASASVVEKD
jgi:hypothetical protein